MSYDSNNIFAKILREEIPCAKVFEDEKVLAFKDINPKASVHLLVIPKEQFVNFHDFHENASCDLVAHFYKIVSHLVQENDLTQTGYRVITNSGVDGGQEVPHYHVHILGGNALGPMLQERL